ncbi:MAG: hypothetical protein H0Z40_04910 [Desulfotomaculum sp.]|nr:hypothetical protein [Desulfotomaculum sp.]
MSIQCKKIEEATEAANLLTTILVRYPEVSTINYDPVKNTIKLNIIFNDVLNGKQLLRLKNYIYDCISVYNKLEKKSYNILNITYHVIETFTILKIERDLDTLVQGEISLIVEGLNQYSLTNIITEKPEVFYEDDLKFQEELIETMLENVKANKENKSLFAFRDEGQVLVFNK